MVRSAFRLLTLVGFVTLAACDAAPETDVPAATPADSPAAAPAATDTAGADALLDPDQASAQELTSIAGLESAVAERIVAGRPYDNMLEVDSVLAESLDEGEREEVYRHLFKPLDLNTASGEEIQLIPGVGDRMQHEFEEYRPYTAIEQFRREIGKYVDEEEVARLERYVVIR